MCYPIGARLAQHHILALDTFYHHLFSTPGRDTTTINQLKHDLVLWLTHHSFVELPDALEYYLADPNSDLEGDLAHLTFLDPWGVQVHIHPLVTIYLNTLLAWAKCFLATYGEYPGLYNRNMSKSKGWTLQSSLLMLWMEKTRVNNQTKIDDDVNLLKTL